MPARLPSASRQFLDDDRAAADDVDPALVHRPERGALVTGHRDQLVAHRQQIAESDAGQVDRRRSRRSSSCCASAASVVMVPATPTQVRARSTGTTRSASPSRSRTTSRAAAISSAVGGSECRQRSVSRTQPMSAEKLASTSRSPEHHLGRPAAEIDHHERRCGGVQFVDRTVKRQRGLLGRR